jgi:hypothetical protein
MIHQTTCLGKPNESLPAPAGPAGGGATPPVRSPHDAPGVPPETIQFVLALFEPADYILVPVVETWTEDGTRRSRSVERLRFRADWLTSNRGPWAGLQQLAGREHGNLFFGVCPREGGGKRGYDLAFQVRVVRALWADVDCCTVEEALARCAAAGLPRPSIVVRSGTGVHLYWLLDEPYRIDDVGPPLPVFWETWEEAFVEGEPVTPSRYMFDKATGRRIYKLPGVSPKGRRLERIVDGISAALGSDDTTHDLSRLLRLPGTLNRKNGRNGAEPTACVLVELDADRRYPLSAFEPFEVAAQGSPQETARKAPGSPVTEPGAPRVAQPPPRVTTGRRDAPALTDEEVLARATAARNAPLFSRLWAGDLTAHGNDHSRADAALVAMLHFWTQGDATQIDRLFRRSALMRDKWDEQRGNTTYGERTIAAVAATNPRVYDPRGAVKPVFAAGAGQPPQPAQTGGPEGTEELRSRFSDINTPSENREREPSGPPLPDPVRRILADLDRGARRPCLIGACLFLKRRENGRSRRAADKSCDRFRCVACGPRKKLGWLRHLVDVLRKHRGPLFAWSGPGTEAPLTLWRLRRLPRPREYARLHTAEGCAVIIATVQAGGFDPIGLDAALCVVARAVDNASPYRRKPISTSLRGEWQRPPQEKTGEWARYGISGDTDSDTVAGNLRSIGIESKIKGGPEGGAITQTADWQFPDELTDEQMDNIQTWIDVGCDPPDPRQGCPAFGEGGGDGAGEGCPRTPFETDYSGL